MTTETENNVVTHETFTMTEAQMKKLARNALLVAGKEMGDEGDHWPVIKNTITEIMMDWEKLEAERNIQAEMKIHLYAQLEDMEAKLKDCPAHEQEAAAPLIAELREVYDAFFTKAEIEELYMSDDDDADLIFEDIEKPAHIKRAEAILDTLMEDDNDDE